MSGHAEPGQRLPGIRGVIWLVVAVGLAALVAAALVGQADSRSPALVSAEPADGVRVTAPPPTVSLTFSSALDPEQTHLLVVGPDGSPGLVGEATVADDTVVQPVELAETGQVVVTYHVVFQDGGETSGQQQFTIGYGGAAGAVGEEGTHVHGAPGLLAAVALVMVAGGAGVLMLMLRRPHIR